MAPRIKLHFMLCLGRSELHNWQKSLWR